MRGPLAPLHHVELLEREVDAVGQGFDAGAEVAFRQRGVLVEEGRDAVGVHRHEEEQHGGGERPQVREQEVAPSLCDEMCC